MPRLKSAVMLAAAVTLLPGPRPTAALAGPAATAPAETRPARAATTEHDFYRGSVGYFRQRLVDVYQASGKHNPAWDAAAATYLGQMAERFAADSVRPFYRPVGKPTADALIAAGRGLVKAGCDDPLVAFCLADLLDKAGDRPGAVARYRVALAAQGTPDFPDVWYVRAAPRLNLLAPAGAPDRQQLGQAFAKRQAAVCSGPMDGVARRQALRALRAHLRTPDWRSLLLRELDKRPDADPWVRDVLAGRIAMDLAWAARGADVAAAVQPRQWQAFLDQLGKSRDALTRAWKAAPDLPEPASEMLIVCRGAGEQLHEQTLDWFTRALAAQVDYEGAYDLYRKAARPRWGGSYEQMLEVGEVCLRDPRYDTLLPWEFAESVRAIGEDADQPWAPLQDPEIRKRVLEVADGYAKALGPGRGDYFASAQAALAMRDHQAAQARAAADAWTKAGGRLDPAAFAYFGLGDGREAVEELYGTTGPWRGFIQGTRMQLHHKPKQAAGDLARIRSQLKPGDPALPYVDRLKTQADANLQFEVGQWAPLVRQGTLSGWQPYAGEWTAAADGSLIGANHEPGGDQFLLYREGPLDPDPAKGFEVSWKVEPGDTTGSVGGQVAGLVFMAQDAPTPFYAEVPIGSQCVQFRFGETRVQRNTAAAIPMGCTVTVRCEKYLVTILVDGAAVGDPYPLPEAYRKQPAVGLGSSMWYAARYTDVRARKVPAAAAATAPAPGAKP